LQSGKRVSHFAGSGAEPRKQSLLDLQEPLSYSTFQQVVPAICAS
jgi:hypothetical protein